MPRISTRMTSILLASTLTAPILLVAARPAAPDALAGAPVERELEAMGTTLRVEVAGLDRPRALALAERMVEAVEAAEARLSTWREGTELGALNRAAVGAFVPLTRPTWEALSAALRCAAATDGAFDPTVAPLVGAWALRAGGRWPSDAELRAALAATGADGIELERAPLGARKRAERALDEGGFGKGAALDLALDRIAEGVGAERSAPVRIDLGGQIAWANAGAPRVVELADPRARSRPVVAVEVEARRGSWATSGNGERGLVVAGRAVGHLLDPRSGRPAPDFGSVAVFAPSALEADCLSTALFVMGPEAGWRWAAARGGAVEAVFLIAEGEPLRAIATPGLAGRVRALAPGVRIEPGMELR